MTKPDRTPVARVLMASWGDVQVVEDTSGMRPSLQYRYAGQYEDGETELLENRYRSLIPGLGVYTSPESLHAWTSSRFAGPQAYAYTAARPLFYMDPDGRRMDKDHGGGGIPIIPVNIQPIPGGRSSGFGPRAPNRPTAPAKKPSNPEPTKSPTPSAKPRSQSPPSGKPIVIPCEYNYTPEHCWRLYQYLLEECDEKYDWMTDERWSICVDDARALYNVLQIQGAVIPVVRRHQAA